MVQADPSKTFFETYTGLSTDLQPPLYFYLLKYLLYVFGYSVKVLRGFSALAGVAGVLAVYKLGKQLADQRLGIYAALLTCINPFHIYYSQEARPYTFLFLFTTLSFLWLLKFLKNPNYRSAGIYGLMSSLMLYGHPYGVFSLVVQALIIAVCLGTTEPAARWVQLKQIVFAGSIGALSFLPAVPLFIRAAEVKDFWIKLPGPDLMSDLFVEFFSGSEFVVISSCVLVLLVVIRASKTPLNSNFITDVRSGGLASTFFILVSWILICVLVPLIRSYTHVPMIVSRYLIGILPPILVLVSLGLYHSTRAFQYLATGIIVIFSLTDLLVVKDYYAKITKSQLREVATGVKENYLTKSPIVSDIKWHYSFFLDREHYNLLDARPSDYIRDMMEGRRNADAFWYINGHHFGLDQLGQPERLFLENNFYPGLSLNYYYAQGYYFVPKKAQRIRIDLNTFKPFSSSGREFIYLYAPATTQSAPLRLEKGIYTLCLEGRSEPSPALNGINAHLSINISGKKVGGMFLDDKSYPTTRTVSFLVQKEQEISVELDFDNDFMMNGKDRNALVYSVYLEKTADWQDRD